MSWLSVSPSSLALLVVLGSCRPYSYPHLVSKEAIRAPPLLPSSYRLQHVVLLYETVATISHTWLRTSSKFRSTATVGARGLPPSSKLIGAVSDPVSFFALRSLAAYPRIEAAARTIFIAVSLRIVMSSQLRSSLSPAWSLLHPVASSSSWCCHSSQINVVALCRTIRSKSTIAPIL